MNLPCRFLTPPVATGELPGNDASRRALEMLLEIRGQQGVLKGIILQGQEKIGRGLEAVAKGQEKLLAVAAAKKAADEKELNTVGRFQYGAGFKDVWIGGEHYDLRGRNKARFCLQYLVAKQAFDPDSARHLENEIDPFVRKKCQLPPPSEIRIQHYFNDRSGKLSRLRSELVKAAGRNGCFYLQVV